MPGGLKTDVGARDALVAARNSIASLYQQSVKVLSDPAVYQDSKRKDEANAKLSTLGSLMAETTAAIAIYDRFLSSDPIADAVNDRAAISSVTSKLPRLNEP